MLILDDSAQIGNMQVHSQMPAVVEFRRVIAEYAVDGLLAAAGLRGAASDDVSIQTSVDIKQQLPRAIVEPAGPLSTAKIIVNFAYECVTSLTCLSSCNFVRREP